MNVVDALSAELQNSTWNQLERIRYLVDLARITLSSVQCCPTLPAVFDIHSCIQSYN